MRGTLVIAGKDFRQIVTSPMYMFVGFLCTVVWSVTFISALRRFANEPSNPFQQGGPEAGNIVFSVFVQHASVINLIFILALPAVTMRLISEEKKMRTYDLLLTSPVSAGSIAVGKFLAGLGAAGVLLLISLVYPLSTSLIVKFDWQVLLVSYLGLLLLTGLYVSTGIFASSLTESPMLSVFLGVILNILIWFISQAGSGGDDGIFAGIMEYLSVGQHLVPFVKGSLRTSSVIFFLSAITFFVFISERIIESARWR